jgi:hypothetical protein
MGGSFSRRTCLAKYFVEKSISDLKVNSKYVKKVSLGAAIEIMEFLLCL